MNSLEFTEEICKILKDGKAEDVVSLCVKEKSDVADYFVVASGRSKTHTRALIDRLYEQTEKIGFAPIRSEGVREGRWAVLDYGDVIVHVFNDETRVLYHLEQLWGDGKNETKN